MNLEFLCGSLRYDTCDRARNAG